MKTTLPRQNVRVHFGSLAVSSCCTFLVSISVKHILIIGLKNEGGYWLFARIFFAFSKLSCAAFRVLQARKIICTIPETTERLYLSGAKEWKFMVRPVSVAFVYHVEVTFPLLSYG